MQAKCASLRGFLGYAFRSYGGFVIANYAASVQLSIHVGKRESIGLSTQMLSLDRPAAACWSTTTPVGVAAEAYVIRCVFAAVAF